MAVSFLGFISGYSTSMMLMRTEEFFKKIKNDGQC